VDAIARHDEAAARAAALKHVQGALRARVAVQRGEAAARNHAGIHDKTD
jgi:hypothetical protein